MKATKAGSGGHMMETSANQHGTFIKKRTIFRRLRLLWRGLFKPTNERAYISPASQSHRGQEEVRVINKKGLYRVRPRTV